MQKIDIHLHMTADPTRETPIPYSDHREMVDYLDKLEIRYGVLMSEGEATNADKKKLAELYPDKFRWMCLLDDHDDDDDNTVYERLKAYQEQGACGVGELTFNKNLNHPFLQSLFKAAEKLQMPVLFHMSPEEDYNYGIVDHPGLPLLEENLKRYPDLIIIGHSQPFWHEITKDISEDREERNSWGEGPVTPGGRVPELLEKYPNLRADMSANSGGCAIMRDPEFGLQFLERFQDQLMFGTDLVNTEMHFPLADWLEKQHAAKKLSDEAYRKVLYENAAKVFDFPEMKE